MAILKCKMCGGDIALSEDRTHGECEYCGSVMTFPRVSDEQRLNLFNRANHFRRQNEFDKAIAAYDRILDQDDADAEAHWGAVLSRYGIEYVEDPVTHERIPTCHRVQPTSILTDPDYLSALEHAPDAESRSLYEREARRIADIQKGILAISSQEKPYDVFICYKETDDSGSRTRDSALAQDIYYQLANEGFKVFFSRITLEDKLGQQYEPYIFAALNSAKVMLVIGTKPEYFNAVWVKNEWGRYLALMKNDRSRLLIPCYRDMDPYDLPDELSTLQSQDMSKIGFIQDIIRGVKKVLRKDAPAPAPRVVVQPAAPAASANIENLMRRAQLFMEDGDWKSAVEYLDKVLDEDAEYAPAYAGKVQAVLKLRKEAELATCLTAFEDTADWKKAVRFATPAQRQVYVGYVTERTYHAACTQLESARTAEDCEKARKVFESISGFSDADAQAEACFEKANRIRFDEMQVKTRRYTHTTDIIAEWLQLADTLRKTGGKTGEQYAQTCEKEASNIREELYEKAVSALAAAASSRDCASPIHTLRALGNYRDAPQQVEMGERQQARMQAEEERQAEEARRQQEAERQRAEAEAARAKRRIILLAIVAAAAVVAIVLYFTVFIHAIQYKAATAALEAGQYDEAAEQFAALGDYKDAAIQAQESKYQKGVAQLENGEYDDATATFEALGDYSDASTQAQESQYQKGVAQLENGEYDDATTTFEALGDYSDAATQVKESQYQKAQTFYQAQDYAEAAKVFITLSSYKDVDSLIEIDDNLAAAAAAAARAAYLAQFEVGNTVKFGHYEQDDNTSNGAEEIEWRVLSNDGEQTLLISEKGLDVVPYNTERANVTWETCSLRKWLNNNFLNAAFTAEEQAQLVTMKVKAGKNPEYSTNPGNDTQDVVFLLSINGVKRYFSKVHDRICYPTDYAKSQGAFTNHYNDACQAWWLRSPGGDGDSAAYVDYLGSVSGGGHFVINDDAVVRPAVVLRLS